MKKPTHPVQPVVIDKQGVARFKENKIVRALLDTGTLDLNKIAVLDFPKEDRIQLAQLIGYSICGASELTYMPDSIIDAAQEEADSLMKNKK